VLFPRLLEGSILKSYFEHANITVINPEHTINFLLSAIPEWKVRGSGNMDNWFGKSINWYHVGDDDSYIAIQGGGEDRVKDWKEHWTGVKHLGIVVPSIQNVIDRLLVADFELDHFGANHPYRKSVYYLDEHRIQFEFIEYLSDEVSYKNDYRL